MTATLPDVDHEAILAGAESALEALDAPPDDEAVTTGAWMVDNDGKADWALRKLAKVRGEIEAVAYMAAQQSMQIRSVIQPLLEEVEDWAESELHRLEQTQEHWEGQLAAYHQRRLLDDDRAKTIRLPHGTLTARKKPDRWTADGEFIDWARDNAPELLRTEANIDAAKRALELDDGRLLMVTSYEIVAGKRVITDAVEVPGITVHVGVPKFEAQT